jgi:hypothetical protein
MGKIAVGENAFVRTVTDYWVGEVISIDGPHTVTLIRAAWVADTGRLHEFTRDGRAANMEVEPLPDGMTVTCQWAAILPWPHPLLREVV